MRALINAVAAATTLPLSRCGVAILIAIFCFARFIIHTVELELQLAQQRNTSIEAQLATVQASLAKLPPPAAPSLHQVGAPPASARREFTLGGPAAAAAASMASVDAASAAGAAASAAVAETSKSIQSLRLRIDETDKQFKATTDRLAESVQMSARSADVATIAEQVMQRMAPAVCGPLFDTIAAELRANVALDLQACRELFKQVDDRCKNANAEAILSRETAARALPEARALAKQLVEDSRADVHVALQECSAALQQKIDSLQAAIDTTCMRRAVHTENALFLQAARDVHRGASDEERVYLFMLDVKKHVDALVRARENEPLTVHLSAQLEQHAVGLEEQTKIVHVLSDRVRSLQKARHSTVTRAEHDALRDEMLGVQQSMSALDPKPFERQLEILQQRLIAEGPSQHVTKLQVDVALLTGKLTECYAHCATMDAQQQRLVTVIASGVGGGGGSASDDASGDNESRVSRNSSSASLVVHPAAAAMPSVMQRDFADENPLLVLLQHRVDTLTDLCRHLSEQVQACAAQNARGDSGTINDRFQAIHLQLEKLKAYTSGLPLLRTAVADFRARADELGVELAKVRASVFFFFSLSLSSLSLSLSFHCYARNMYSRPRPLFLAFIKCLCARTPCRDRFKPNCCATRASSLLVARCTRHACCSRTTTNSLASCQCANAMPLRAGTP